MLQSELFGLLERTADAAFCVDEQGVIRSWNAAAEKLFGYSSSEAMGKSCDQLLRGRGSLGARVCTRELYAREAADESTIPNFDLEVLSDHFKSGQQLSLQNRPTGLAVQD